MSIQKFRLTVITVLALLGSIFVYGFYQTWFSLAAPVVSLATPTQSGTPVLLAASASSTATPPASPSAIPPRATPSVPPLSNYTVRPGDTLDLIAVAHFTDLAALLRINAVADVNTVWVGQVLQVPTLRWEVYTVSAGDGSGAIATRYGITPEQLWFWNRDLTPDWLYVGQVLQIPQVGGGAPLSPAMRDVTAPTQPLELAQPASTAVSETPTPTPTATVQILASLAVFDRELIGVAVEQRAAQARDKKSQEVMAPFPLKKIVVSISQQKMYVYEKGELQWEWWVSTGLASHPTRPGYYAVQSKLENPYSNAWNVWMPNRLGIYWAGSSENGIHALPILDNGVQLWSGGLGSPQSYGCVILGVWEAQTLWDWAEIGTPVVILQ